MCIKTKQTKETNDIPYTHCLNCGSELQGKYCHHCGQQSGSTSPTIRGFILEYANNAFLWDSKLGQTLWQLIRRPGHLTNEFLSGKFISYVHPLKLNMFFLFAFITMFVLFSSADKLNNSVNELTSDESVFSALQTNYLMKTPEYVDRLKSSPRDTVQLAAPLQLAEQYPDLLTNLNTIEDKQGDSLDKWVAVIPRLLIDEQIVTPDSAGVYHFNTQAKTRSKDLDLVDKLWRQLIGITTNYFPLIVLLTTPFLTLSLRIVQRKDKRRLFDHFIFALHYTAFLEFMIIFIYLLYLIASPSMSLLKWIITISSCGYLVLAFRRAYGINSWVKSIFKALITSTVYHIICFWTLICIFITACIIVADVF